MLKKHKLQMVATCVAAMSVLCAFASPGLAEAEAVPTPTAIVESDVRQQPLISPTPESVQVQNNTPEPQQTAVPSASPEQTPGETLQLVEQPDEQPASQEDAGDPAPVGSAYVTQPIKNVTGVAPLLGAVEGK